MDTVHGTRSEKILLTFQFRNCSLMLAFIIDSYSQAVVKEAVDKLYAILGHIYYPKLDLSMILLKNK